MILGDPNYSKPHPVFCSTFRVAFNIFVTGGRMRPGLADRLIIVSPSLWTTNHPWKGRGRGHPVMSLEWMKLGMHFRLDVRIDTDKRTDDRLLPKGMRSGSRDLVKFWEVTDIISLKRYKIDTVTVDQH